MRYDGKSHAGLCRKNNQDSFCVVENDKQHILALVCDGIGGGKAGDVASKMASDYMRERFLQARLDNLSDTLIKHWLTSVIQGANDMIFTQAKQCESQRGMGTTLVGILRVDKTTYVFNVGDSRTYGVYGDDFICLTEDHSYVADLLKHGEISYEQAKHHPRRNVITNALGIWNTFRIDINKIKEDYTTLLICSDGLHGYVNEGFIQSVLKSKHTSEEKVNLLIEAALAAGGYDNVSVIVLDKEESDNE